MAGAMRAAGIIPAYAGSTNPRSCSTVAVRDHPRIRGEHASTHSSVSGSCGSSPHTRGALNRVRRYLHNIGIIPAYAGSTRARRRRCVAGRDHPRIRGEHAPFGSPSNPDPGSSPHTRGALAVALPPSVYRGIIPAYAGSTCRGEDSASCRGDHPRIRGEHITYAGRLRPPCGSSPHTRGAPRRRSRRPSVFGIIPAYAGSTRGKDLHPVDIGGSSPHTRGAPSMT